MPDQKPFQNTRQYLFTPRQVRLAVGLGTVGMMAVIVVLLFLASSRPQGRFQALDDRQFQQHLEASTAPLSGYSVDGDRATLEIGRAIELVAERGVQNPGFAGAAPVAAGAAGTTGATGATDTTGTGEASGEGTEAGAPGAGAEGTPEAAGAEGALPDGEAAFQSTCAACHQATGQGIPGAFPPLAGHAPDLYAADPALIPAIILFGMQGPINVGGMAYNGLMPAHQHVDDATIAAISNHLMTAWGNDAAAPDFTPYSAADVADIRGESLSMADVYDLRTAAGLE